MNFKEYSTFGYLKYAHFAEIVKEILVASIGAKNITIGLQQIQTRSKDSYPLRRKLESKKLLNSKRIERHIKDLAGCRMIFYFNDDVDRLINSRLIHENFEVVVEETKIHHPKPDEQSVNHLYRAIHYIVKLDPKRIELPEYEKFQDYQCEIQLQTILNHAWSETAHDITYKFNPIKGIGKNYKESIDKQVVALVKDQIAPAGYALQNIKNDNDKYLRGEQLYKEGVLKLFKKLKDNDERYAFLVDFQKYLLPIYDDHQREYKSIIRLLECAIKVSKKTKPRKVKSPWGIYDGRTAEDIFSLAMEIINDIKFVDFKATFSFLLKLDLEPCSETEKKKLHEVFEKMVSLNGNLIKKYGPVVQVWVSDQLSRWGGAKLKSHSELIPIICSALLSPYCESTEVNFDGLIINKTNLNVINDVRKIRKTAVDVLKKLFYLQKEPQKKINTFHALSLSGSTPTQGEYTQEFLENAIEHSINLIHLATEMLLEDRYEVLQVYEEKVFRLWLKFNAIVKSKNNSSKVKHLAKKGCNSAIELKSILDCLDEYQIFKLLIGFNSTYDHDWKLGRHDHQRGEEYRKHQISEILKSINVDDFAEWKRLLELCASVESNGMATFPKCQEFLECLTKEYPDFGFRLLKTSTLIRNKFGTSILAGLFDGRLADEVRQYLLDSVRRNQNVGLCALSVQLNNGFSIPNLKRITKYVIAKNISWQINVMLKGHLESVEKIDSRTWKELVAPTLIALSNRSDASWINLVWFRDEWSQNISSFSTGEIELILKNLIHTNNFDYHLESTLKPIAIKFPERIISFLCDRIIREEKGGLLSGYQALPHQFQGLESHINRNPDEVLRVVRSRAKLAKNHRYTLTQFVAKLYPDFPRAFELSLLRLVNEKGNSGIEFVILILNHYKGVEFHHKICQEIIKKVNSKSKYLKMVESILESTDVVMGERGYSSALEGKIQAMKKWLRMRNENIKSFASKYIKQLELRLAQENRRVDSDLAARHHEFEN